MSRRSSTKAQKFRLSGAEIVRTIASIMETKPEQTLEDNRPRRTYEPPSVTDFGNAAELTLQSSNSNGDIK